MVWSDNAHLPGQTSQDLLLTSWRPCVQNPSLNRLVELFWWHKEVLYEPGGFNIRADRV